jgi:hypothetical protein
MVGGGVLTDEQPLADLAVGEPGGDESEHVGLPFGQPTGKGTELVRLSRC